MADPFLLAHIVAPLRFDIAGSLTPVSIRDQMVRARLMVDRAIEQKLLAPQRNLLVVGAGAAGVTAAIRAAQCGIRAVLLDRAAWPFQRQAGCTTRWVDPTQYDFPVDHWPRGRYPWRPPAMPLHWRRDFASHLAIQWSQQLARATGLLDLRCNATLAPNPFNLVGTPALVEARWTEPKTPPQRERFGMVLSTVGFGSERCKVGSYRGYRFWDADRFGQPNCGLGSSVAARVLISGGGDGALQDFLRVTTRKPARKIYRPLREHQQLASRFAAIERRIHNAEDQAARAYVWATKAHECAVHRALHQLHETIVDDLRMSPEWSIVRLELRKLVDPPHEITLVYPHDHFAQCYALNRFLVLLIAKYLEADGRSPLRGGNRVTDVTGHGCQAPGSCHGQDHVVELQEGACDGFAGARSSQTANVVIVRHGVDPPAYVFGRTRIVNPHPRQVLPYHLTA